MDTGIKGHTEQTVTVEMTADQIGSGLVAVYATPSMIALIEQTCSDSVLPYLGPDEVTVGTHLDIAHTAATPIGMKVWCESQLIAVDDRKLTFQVDVYDECGHIGEGQHERFVVNKQRFQSKTDNKLNQIAKTT